MEALVEYISGRGEAPSRREMNRLIERHEWFTTARRARALITGEPDLALVLPLMFWPTAPTAMQAERNLNDRKSEAIRNTQEEPNAVDLIDRFIEHGGYRIVPTDDAREAEVDIDIDPDMVTEELAAIYRAQGLHTEAEKIERTLNTPK